MHRTTRTAIALLLGGSLLLTACGSDDPEPADGTTPTTEATTEAATDPTIVAEDFAFDGPDTWAAGPQSVTLENDGEEDHEMVLVGLDEGYTIDDVLTEIQENPEGDPPPWVQIVGGTFAKPGTTSEQPLKADLQPGTYTLVCFVPSKANDGQPHAALGMVKEITVA